MHPKAQTVEQRAGAENAIMTGEFACQIGKRIRRVGYDKQHGVRRRLVDRRNDLAINLGILVQEAQAPSGSLRSVAPPDFSLTPTVTMTSAAPARSE
jgi:hypothetical protein